MTKIILTVLLFSIGTSCFGQAGLSLIGFASKSLSQKDTSQTIRYLEIFAQTNPKSGLVLVLNQRLAEFYIQRHQFDSAISKLNYAFQLVPTEEFLWKGIDSFANLVTRYQFNSVRADISVLLSKLYLLRNDKKNALHYLNLADTKYLPSYGGCANGMIMYRTFLSLKYADYYLIIGDTTKAVNRLLDYFLLGEPFSLDATKRLRQILHYKYSTEEIGKEIDRGIANVKIITDKSRNEPEKMLYFSIFGHTIHERAYVDLKEHQQRLRKNENLSILRA